VNHLTSGPLTSSFNPPQTPYTPYTAFASKQNPFEFSQSSILNSVHLLDEGEDALARVYNQVLRFVERDLRKLMEIGEKVCLRGIKEVTVGEKGLVLGKHLSKASGEGNEKDGFEILANVIWADFGKAIMDEMGGVVFAAGRPGEFRKVIKY
jgi:hypothetical protein